MPTSLGIRPMISRELVSFPLQPLAKTTKSPSHIRAVFQLFSFMKSLFESFTEGYDFALASSPGGCPLHHTFIHNGGHNQNNPRHHELPLLFHTHQSQPITDDSKNHNTQKSSQDRPAPPCNLGPT